MNMRDAGVEEAKSSPAPAPPCGQADAAKWDDNNMFLTPDEATFYTTITSSRT